MFRFKLLLAPILFSTIRFNFRQIHCEAQRKPILRINLQSDKLTADIIRPSLSSILWRHLKRDLILFALIIALTFMTAFVAIQTPIALSHLATVIQSPIRISLRAPLSKLFLLLSAQSFLGFINTFSTSILILRMRVGLQRELFDSILSRPLTYFNETNTSDLVLLLSDDVDIVTQAVRTTLRTALPSLLQIVTASYTLLSVSPILTLHTSALLTLAYSLISAYGMYLRKLSKELKVLVLDCSKKGQDVIENIRTVKSFTNEDHEISHMDLLLDFFAAKSSSLSLHGGIFGNGIGLTVSVVLMSVINHAYSLIIQGKMDGDGLMLYLLGMRTIQSSVMGLGQLIVMRQKLEGSGERVIDCLIGDVDNFSAPSNNIKQALEEVTGDIIFEDLSFQYKSRSDPVISKFNLTIPSGSTVAICGPSGGGKSTLGLLLQRFYVPNSGEIRLGGKDLISQSTAEIRSQIGYIDQNTSLFATNILENIRYGNLAATDDEVYQAAKDASAYDFITSFELGFHTLVGERGAMLSGGQKQRIAIARALLKSPRILILDEATSALDVESEALVQIALDKLIEDKKRTVIIIAHRLSTIRKADVIVVMDSGRVIEQGSHELLMAQKGTYYRMNAS